MKTRSFSSAAAATDSCSRFWRSAPSRAAPARSTPGAVTALGSPDRSETVYTAELLPCDDWDGAVDEETVKKSFSLIVAEWTTGEN